MAWIESHQGLARHLKTKRLARKLGISVPATIGHLHLLWWWALDNLPDGDLTVMEYEDIADEMMWDDDPHKLITALIESGFVDDVDGTLFIHDWHDYIGRLLDKRKKETERKREYRRKSEGKNQPVQRNDDGCPAGQDADTTQDGGRNRTVPNRTIPNSNKDKEKEKEDAPPRKGTPRKKTALEKNTDKTIYAEFVRMKPDEYEKLVDQYGKEYAHECIIALDNYKGANNKTYASDYRAILNWVVKRVEEDRTKIKPFPRGGQSNGESIRQGSTTFYDQQATSSGGALPSKWADVAAAQV